MIQNFSFCRLAKRRPAHWKNDLSRGRTRSGIDADGPE
jgi:hypothetical protein